MLKLEPGLKLYIYAPLVERSKRRDSKKRLHEITKKGFQRSQDKWRALMK